MAVKARLAWRARRTWRATRLKVREQLTGVEPMAPTIERGCEIGPPHFVGVAAQRAGTSWWFELLMDHPQSYMAPGQSKEQHFFDRYWEKPFAPTDVDRYHRRFPRPHGRKSGEWTPRYLHDFWVVPLLARAAPDARVLVMLRDPVERYRSGVVHDMIKHSRDNKATISNDALDRGRYHSQLTRLLGHVPREKLLLLQYERCVADPAGEYRRTLEFLGYDDTGFVPTDLRRPVRATKTVKAPLPAHVTDELTARLAGDVSKLATDFGDALDLSLWKNFSVSRS
ncbi:MAG: sulfotransferase [Actinomycetia bacterium]|nr:sulfotransferase [Actinomycetes bacterium]